ncbi:hypothetical protein [Pedobacter mucosus]|uniref:hypothetical protein n=1 Tax=Pedobacter mucosus TaxID=2895286 RepID=UPI001EE41C3A|nr:hypothetical protein [Pedobacter mucosus]UKT66052.1 hypothetical protein LOK61_09720 [Pedobacter mucosus]
MEFKYIAIILCLLLFIFLLYKEISRADKARLIWRILASAVAVACFALLITPIKYDTHLKQNANEIILLTKGTNPDSISKIAGQKYALTSAELKNVKATLIPDLPYFLATHKDIHKLNIYGYGLTNEELKTLKGYEISFHPTAKPSGIISANWQHRIKTSESLQIQGIYQNTDNKAIKLVLKGLGNSVDSILIAAKSTKSFSFNSRPKQLGKAIFQLISIDGADTVAKEPIPFIVGEQSPMSVLILASFPDFEYKFLKKWLYENQYPLAFRSQISKNKYSADFLNLDSLNINSINASTLKKFDVLIIDEEELVSISAEERTAIDFAVNNGMGLLIRISNPKASTPLSARFGRYELPAVKDKQLSLLMNDRSLKFSNLPLEQKLFLRPNQSDQPLITDASGKTLVNSSIKGAGKILISSISSTFNWMLSGKTTDYSKYWSEVLSKSARKKNDIQSFKIVPEFPSVNEKTQLVVDLAASGKIPKLNINSINLAPRQNMELPFQWDAMYWPTISGWNNLAINQSTESLYIYNKDDWQTLKNQETINSTQQFSDDITLSQIKSTKIDTVITKEVSMWWFFIGFLIASGFLWYESRILQAK